MSISTHLGPSVAASKADHTWRLVGDVLDEALEGVHRGEGGAGSSPLLVLSYDPFLYVTEGISKSVIIHI